MRIHRYLLASVCWVALCLASLAEQETRSPVGKVEGLRMKALDFDTKGTNFYVDHGRWLAIHPEKHKSAEVSAKFPHETGSYTLILQAVGEDPDFALAQRRAQSLERAVAPQLQVDRHAGLEGAHRADQVTGGLDGRVAHGGEDVAHLAGQFVGEFALLQGLAQLHQLVEQSAELLGGLGHQ